MFGPSKYRIILNIWPSVLISPKENSKSFARGTSNDFQHLVFEGTLPQGKAKKVWLSKTKK